MLLSILSSAKQYNDETSATYIVNKIYDIYNEHNDSNIDESVQILLSNINERSGKEIL